VLVGGGEGPGERRLGLVQRPAAGAAGDDLERLAQQDTMVPGEGDGLVGQVLGGHPAVLPVRHEHHPGARHHGVGPQEGARNAIEVRLRLIGPAGVEQRPGCQYPHLGVGGRVGGGGVEQAHGRRDGGAGPAPLDEMGQPLDLGFKARRGVRRQRHHPVEQGDHGLRCTLALGPGNRTPEGSYRLRRRAGGDPEVGGLDQPFIVPLGLEGGGDGGTERAGLVAGQVEHDLPGQLVAEPHHGGFPAQQAYVDRLVELRRAVAAQRPVEGPQFDGVPDEGGRHQGPPGRRRQRRKAGADQFGEAGWGAGGGRVEQVLDQEGQPTGAALDAADRLGSRLADAGGDHGGDLLVVQGREPDRG
jgi:hypothetical protein